MVMSISSELALRSGSSCELCGHAESLEAFTVPPKNDDSPDNQVVICGICKDQINNPEKIDANHWRCLNESMWSEVPAVQVMAYRMLNILQSNDWAQDLLNMIYLDEGTLEWAQSGSEEEVIVHKDSNGNILEAGDTVVIIKDLNVKGANFTAKRGTAVRKIRLDPNNASHIEGKVDGQHIVILTQYVKKS